MLSKSTEKSRCSSQFITFLADFGIPILDSAVEAPNNTILSDFGNGTVWQNS
jgi:hypothetical protein